MTIKTPDRFRGNDAFFIKMLRKFADDHLREPRLDFAEAIKDAEKLKVLVHTIKGVAGNLDVTNVYESAAAFESSLRGGDPSEELYNKFILACDEVKDAVATL